MIDNITDENIEAAWNLASPLPDMEDRLFDTWEDLSEDSRQHIRDAIKRVADQLPEQPEREWRRWNGEKFRNGDRVLIEGSDWSFEFEVKFEDTDLMCVNPRNGEPIYIDNIDLGWNLAVYRIPAPVEHPDPEEHQVIIATDWAGKNPGEPSRELFCTGVYYRNRTVAMLPEHITEWVPASVVPKSSGESRHE